MHSTRIMLLCIFTLISSLGKKQNLEGVAIFLRIYFILLDIYQRFSYKRVCVRSKFIYYILIVKRIIDLLRAL